MPLPCSRDVGRSELTQVSQGSKTSESRIKPIFLFNIVWDTPQLVPCIQLEFEEEKWNEKPEEEGNEQGK